MTTPKTDEEIVKELPEAYGFTADSVHQYEPKRYAISIKEIKAIQLDARIAAIRECAEIARSKRTCIGFHCDSNKDKTNTFEQSQHPRTI